jgi:large repetitive protein
MRLRVTDEHGTVDEDTARVTVDDAAPQAKLSAPTTRTLNTPLTFDASGSSDSDGSIVKYEWDTGSGWQPGTSRFSPAFTQAGTYTVRLRVTDDFGKTTTTSYTFTLASQAPIAIIGLPLHPVTGTPATFDGTSSFDPDGTVVKYQWDLNGNGTYESSGAHPSWTYTTAGSYTVRLKVTDANGSVSAVVTAQVTVAAAGDAAPVPVLSFPGSGLLAGQPVRLSAAGSTDPDGTIAKYQWDVDGDGTVDATTTVDYLDWTYTLPGAYAVTLTVTDNGYAQAGRTAVLTIR